MSVVLHYLGEMGGVMLLALPPWLLLRTLWLLAKKQSPGGGGSCCWLRWRCISQVWPPRP